MEESEEILMSSLKNLGINIPSQITSIKDLDSSSFFSISSQSLNLLLPNTNTSSFSASLPDAMAEKVKSCTDMASLFQNLGYPSEISFHQFLYPSEEDLYKLVRFLVERLSELSEARKTVNVVDNVKPETLENNARPISRTKPEKAAEQVVDLNNRKVRARLHGMGSEGDAPVSSENSDKVSSLENNHVDENLDDAATTGRVDEQVTEACTGDLKKSAQIQENAVTGICKGEQESTSCEDLSPEVEGLCGQETVFPEEATVKDLESRPLVEKHELLKEARRLALDNEHSVGSYTEQLHEQISTRKKNLQELENQRDIDKKSLEEKRWKLLESLCENKPESQVKLQKLKEINKEMNSVLSEIKRREEECAKLAGDLEKQPKVASRRSYIERITEITKNSRKLDTDIERILKDTRELKIESNSIEERLHRTYAVVDEKIFREAKKDPVGRQAYRILTNIHESFEKIREQILEADKAQREVAELEAKLSAIAFQSLDKDKLQADLDAMKRENKHLEDLLHH
ncbi:Coiled-coil domain-containing protein 22 [Bienertia sinuspersici]